MRCYIVDPEKKEIVEAEHNGDYREIYEIIGNGCHAFDVVRFGESDAAFIDDEGLLKANQSTAMWKVPSVHPIAGRAVILGTDRSGESCAPANDIGFYRGIVTFESMEASMLRESLMPSGFGKMVIRDLDTGAVLFEEDTLKGLKDDAGAN